MSLAAHLKPEEVNKLVEERGDDVVFFDGRNAFEAKIGKFKNRYRSRSVRTTHDFIRGSSPASTTTLRTSRSSPTAPVVFAAEILSALTKNRGFKEIYQIGRRHRALRREVRR